MIKNIELKYSGDENDPQRHVDYMESLSPLQEVKHLTGVAIPEEDLSVISDYDFSLMRDHIRTDRSDIISSAAIYVISSNSVSTEMEPNLDRNVRDKEYNNIAIKPRRVTGSRHDQSNKWGVYRLLVFLRNWMDNEDQIKIYKNDLCNLDLFFKKKINDEIELYDKTIFDKNNFNIKTSLDLIKNNDQVIALIDDMAEYGWRDVFELIFGSNKIHIFKDTESFRVKSNKWNKYAMIILDLRVDENDSDSDDNILSGNRLLRDVKEKNPEIPILIITASNKYNNLKDSIDFGANDYWVKESYELGVSSEYNYENSFKLIRSIEKCMKWNIQNRSIIENMHLIQSSVDNKNLSNQIESKISLVTALMHNSFSQFIDSKLGTAVIENVFETVFSIFNVITKLYYQKIDIQKDDVACKEIILSLECEKEILRIGVTYNDRKFKLDSKYSKMMDLPRDWKYPDYPQKLFLILKGAAKARKNFYKYSKLFKMLNNKRNNLGNTHGLNQSSVTLSNTSESLELMLLITQNLTPDRYKNLDLMTDEEE